ncbi:hypothetical protein EMCG_01157 [[Emmonsia] crescens]|uniref:Uncharacterized protein n=1 Tax=[Emmonsia] crescens TaxID=73230 RepID=A0A0G2JAQ1_9EURO|nr:hypothetical protein EMCG_01157 [Emmonsia crescens UAMH 3008]
MARTPVFGTNTPLKGDDDGSESDDESEYEKFNKKAAEQRGCWSLEQWMNAFYIKPSNLGRLEQLGGLVQTAEFYDTLPIISRFVEASLQNSEDFISPVSRLMSNAVKTLYLALKLKATALFRQSFIHIICLYHQDITDDLTSQDNEDLIPLVNLYYVCLYRDIADVNFFLMKACVNHEYMLH